MEAANENGYRSIGIDLDNAAVDEANKLGLNASCANVIDHLSKSGNTYEGIFAAHLVEHLTPESAQLFFEASQNALKAHGILCVITPNPGSLPTITHEFWRDPSHIRPYDLEAIEFLSAQAGLKIIKAEFNVHSERGLVVDPNYLIPGSNMKNTIESEAETETKSSSISNLLAMHLSKSTLVDNMMSRMHQHNRDIQQLQDELNALKAAFSRFLEQTYEPSEIFVVAQKD